MSVQVFKTKIASGNIEEVFDNLLSEANCDVSNSKRNEILLLRSQLSNAKKELGLKFITGEEYDVKISKITFRLLQLIDSDEDVTIENRNASTSLTVLQDSAYSNFLTGYILLHKYKKSKKAKLYLQEALSEYISLSHEVPKSSQVYLDIVKTLKQLIMISPFQKYHLNRKIKYEVNKYTRH